MTTAFATPAASTRYTATDGSVLVLLSPEFSAEEAAENCNRHTDGNFYPVLASAALVARIERDGVLSIERDTWEIADGVAVLAEPIVYQSELIPSEVGGAYFLDHEEAIDEVGSVDEWIAAVEDGMCAEVERAEEVDGSVQGLSDRQVYRLRFPDSTYCLVAVVEVR